MIRLFLILRFVASKSLSNLLAVLRYFSFNLNISKGCQINFPIKLEGKGLLTIGVSSKIESGSTFAISKGSSLLIGNQVKIGQNFSIVVTNNSNASIAANCYIGYNCNMMAHNTFFLEEKVTIQNGCCIFSREKAGNGKLHVDKGTYIGDNTIIDLTGDVSVGSNVAIGPNCTLYTHDHEYRKSVDEPAWKGPTITAPIIIHEGAWVGSNVTLLPGVTIGKKAVVASGAVVTKSVNAYSVVAGVPARQIDSYDE